MKYQKKTIESKRRTKPNQRTLLFFLFSVLFIYSHMPCQYSYQSPATYYRLTEPIIGSNGRMNLPKKFLGCSTREFSNMIFVSKPSAYQSTYLYYKLSRVSNTPNTTSTELIYGNCHSQIRKTTSPRVKRDDDTDSDSSLQVRLWQCASQSGYLGGRY
jgi:hypothetical protein